MTSPRAGAGPDVLLSSGSLFHLPLERIAVIAREAGYDGLELIVNTPDLVPGQALLDTLAGVPVRSLHAPFRQWSRWGGQLRSWQATVALGNFLPEADNVTLHPPSMGIGEIVHYRWFRKAQDLPVILGARRGLSLSLENLPWSERAPLSRDPFGQLMATLEEKDLALTLDVCHLGVSRRSIIRDLRKVPAARLTNVHFSDCSCHMEHLWPGEGELPLHEFLLLLREMRYRGHVTLEVSPACFPGHIEAATAKLAAMREWIGDALSLASSEDASGAEAV
jgi:sugar phosphate isomerase/epimerase